MDTVKSPVLLKAISNNGRKRRSRKQRENLVVDEHLSTEPQKLTTMREKTKLYPKIAGYEPDDSDDLESVSADVIFVPSTQTTRYSAARSAKTNLQRRMDGYEIAVTYGSGEGTLMFHAKTELSISCNGSFVPVLLSAECIASAHDMAIKKLNLQVAEQPVVTLEPASNPMSPEDATVFIHRLVTNYVNNRGN